MDNYPDGDDRYAKFPNVLAGTSFIYESLFNIEQNDMIPDIGCCVWLGADSKNDRLLLLSVNYVKRYAIHRALLCEPRMKTKNTFFILHIDKNGKQHWYGNVSSLFTHENSCDKIESLVIKNGDIVNGKLILNCVDKNRNKFIIVSIAKISKLFKIVLNPSQYGLYDCNNDQNVKYGSNTIAIEKYTNIKSVEEFEAFYNDYTFPLLKILRPENNIVASWQMRQVIRQYLHSTTAATGVWRKLEEICENSVKQNKNDTNDSDIECRHIFDVKMSGVCECDWCGCIISSLDDNVVMCEGCLCMIYCTKKCGQAHWESGHGKKCANVNQFRGKMINKCQIRKFAESEKYQTWFCFDGEKAVATDDNGYEDARFSNNIFETLRQCERFNIMNDIISQGKDDSIIFDFMAAECSYAVTLSSIVVPVLYPWNQEKMSIQVQVKFICIVIHLFWMLIWLHILMFF